eukprot:Nk52_evm1s281 gene=Nk52_evmTU1s281
MEGFDVPKKFFKCQRKLVVLPVGFVLSVLVSIVTVVTVTLVKYKDDAGGLVLPYLEDCTSQTSTYVVGLVGGCVAALFLLGTGLCYFRVVRYLLLGAREAQQLSHSGEVDNKEGTRVHLKRTCLWGVYGAGLFYVLTAISFIILLALEFEGVRVIFYGCAFFLNLCCWAISFCLHRRSKDLVNLLMRSRVDRLNAVVMTNYVNYVTKTLQRNYTLKTTTFVLVCIAFLVNIPLGMFLTGDRDDDNQYVSLGVQQLKAFSEYCGILLFCIFIGLTGIELKFYNMVVVLKKHSTEADVDLCAVVTSEEASYNHDIQIITKESLIAARMKGEDGYKTSYDSMKSFA